VCILFEFISINLALPCFKTVVDDIICIRYRAEALKAPVYRVHCYIPEMVILQRVRECGSNLSRDSSDDLNASTLSHLTKESLRWFQSI
jgi:hypothetical protein